MSPVLQWPSKGSYRNNKVFCHLVPDCCPRVQEGQNSDTDKQSPGLWLIINEAVNESACYYWELSRDPGLYSQCCKSVRILCSLSTWLKRTKLVQE